MAHIAKDTTQYFFLQWGSSREFCWTRHGWQQSKYSANVHVDRFCGAISAPHYDAANNHLISQPGTALWSRQLNQTLIDP
jgi:hypothetical protein